MCADGTGDGGGYDPPQFYSDPDLFPPLRGIASVVDVGVLPPMLFPVRGFKTNTFSALFPQFHSNASL